MPAKVLGIVAAVVESNAWEAHWLTALAVAAAARQRAAARMRIYA
jgi:hypothetical protein